MSHLKDILRKASPATVPAMGFRPAAPTKPRMVLIAAINEALSEMNTQIQGADAIIISTDIKPRGLKTLTKTLSVPWGIWIITTAQENAAADFVIFEPEKAGLNLISNENLGKIIAIEPLCDNNILHGISELPADAVILKRAPQDDLTWLDLLQCRRLATITTKPLLVPVASDTPPTHLKALWEAGVDGLVVVATAGCTLLDLRKKMDTLDLSGRRKGLRARPLVPLMASAPSPAHCDEDDEGEEEE